MAARSRFNLWLIGAALLTVSVAVASGAPPRGAPAATRPATKPASTAKLTPAQKAAVDTAIEALRKEVAANQKNPKAPLRTQADYFADKKPAALTPDAVLTALEQPLPG